MEHVDLLQFLCKTHHKRTTKTAATFIREAMPGLLEDPARAEELFGMGHTQRVKEALGGAAKRLTYTTDRQTILGGVKWVAGRKDATIGSPVGQAEQIPGCIMTVDLVNTTTEKDLEGDLLESGGAQVDPAHPLLFGHIPTAPAGKFLKLLSQSSLKVASRYGVADTPLGRDCAQLIEFGCVRASIGFAPLEYEPLKGGNGGWHVTKYIILETSLVTIPANQSAVITAFSRNKLHSPLVKSWAAGLSNNRPLMVKSGWDGGTAPRTLSNDGWGRIPPIPLPETLKPTKRRVSEEDIQIGIMMAECIQAALDAEEREKALRQEELNRRIDEAVQHEIEFQIALARLPGRHGGTDPDRPQR